jgi:hypothetical protein
MVFGAYPVLAIRKTYAVVCVFRFEQFPTANRALIFLAFWWRWFVLITVGFSG